MSESTAKLNLDVNTGTAQQNTQQLISVLGQLASKLSDAKSKTDDLNKAHEGLGKQLEFASRTFNEVSEAGKKVYEIFEQAGELAKFSAEMENLRKKVPVERLNAMREAVEGTVDKITLMKFSLTAMQGDLRLTETGLNIVLTAAHNLSDKGFGTTTENAQKLMHTLESGRTKELKAFNIQIDESKDKQDNLNRTLEKLHTIAEEEVPLASSLKQVELAQAAWADFVTDVKTGLGTIVMEIGKGIATLLGLLPKTHAQMAADDFAKDARAKARKFYPTSEGGGEGTDFSGFATPEDHSSDALQQIKQELEFQVEFGSMWSLDSGMRKMEKDKSLEGNAVEGKVAKRLGGPDAAQKAWDKMVRDLKYRWGKEEFERSDANPWMLGGGSRSLHAVRDRWAKEEEEQNNKEAAEFLLGHNHPLRPDDLFLGDEETVYSPMERGKFSFMGHNQEKNEDFEKSIGDRTTMLGGAFDTMSQGLSASVEAAISGSESIGKAFMKASAMALKSLAAESAVKALYYTAQGIAFSIFSPGDAAKSFASAAAYGAAAIAAGAGSAALGAGAGGAGGGGGGGSSANSPTASNFVGGVSQRGGVQNIVVNVTGAVTAGDYAALGQTIQKAVQTGQAAGKTNTNESSTTVRFS